MILSKEIAEKKLRRMAMEVAERNHDKGSLILIGIKENGIVIAEKIASLLKDIFPGSIEILWLSMDKKHPADILLSKTIPFTDTNVILIDDVANSGRTMFYALQPLLKDHPRQVETLALLERTHKRFPIQLNYVGHSVSTTRDEMIVVKVSGGEVEGAFFKS
jgi:pyrimidine operon attenuation protein/uracil phosphoribosyltransferase